MLTLNQTHRFKDVFKIYMLDYNLTLVSMVTRFIISKTEENLGDTTQRKCLFKIQFKGVIYTGFEF